MGEKKLALHAHDWTVATKTYIDRPMLADFFRILAVDSHNGTEFVMAVEAKKYPIAGTMNHPET
jgi:anthranilate/para-aminobenzoate synthase component II